MYGCIKTLKHNVGTTVRLAYHGCKNLTDTSKTRHVKRIRLVELLGSWFACLLLFQTAKNRMQRNRRAKWCEVQIRTVARKSSIGDITFPQGTWHSENLTKSPLICSVLYLNLSGWEPLIWGIRPKRAFVILFLFSYFLSLWGRVMWLTIGKVTFACYSISLRSSLIFVAWEQYKLVQALNSHLISEWLSKRKSKWKDRKNHI